MGKTFALYTNLEGTKLPSRLIRWGGPLHVPEILLLLLLSFFFFPLSFYSFLIPFFLIEDDALRTLTKKLPCGEATSLSLVVLDDSASFGIRRSLLNSLALDIRM